MTGGSDNFQFSGIIVVSPDDNILSFGNKTFRPAEHKITVTISNNFAIESLGVVVSGVISTVFPTIVTFIPRVRIGAYEC